MKRRFLWLIVAVLLFAVTKTVAYAENAGTLTLPSDLEVIEAESFAGLSEVTEVELPGTLRRIESRAFSGTSIGWVYLPSSIEFIAEDAFDRGVFFEYEPSSYAAAWVKEHTRFEIELRDVPEALLLFEDNWDFGDDLALLHDSALGVFSLDDYAQLRQFHAGEPTWRVEVLEGDVQIGVNDWVSGGWLELQTELI